MAASFPKFLEKLIYFTCLSILLYLLVGISIKICANSDTLYNPSFTYTYVTNVDNPASISKIIEDIELEVIGSDGQAIDVSNINVRSGSDYYNNVLNQPTSNSRTLGNYEITLRCYDENGNYADCTILVSVVDTVAPVVDTNHSKLVYNFKRSEINSSTNAMILKGIVASDNHDYILNYAFSNSNLNLVENVGLHTYTVIVRDSSNNVCSVNVEIDVEDDIGPKIDAIRTYLRFEATTTPIDEEELVEDYFKMSAMDEFTNQILPIDVDVNEYSSNSNKPGIYLFQVSSRINANIIPNNTQKDIKETPP